MTLMGIRLADMNWSHLLLSKQPRLPERGTHETTFATSLRSFELHVLELVSEQADVPENYSAIEFSLAPEAGGTHLRLTHTNLTTPEIFGHWRCYWRMALQRLKRLAEEA
jgi:hypothetical protein